MSFSLAFLGCIRAAYPVNPRHILAGNPVGVTSLGDLIYNAGNFYRGTSDLCPAIAYQKNGTGAVISFGAAVNGMLPAGTSGGIISGGSGYPVSTTFPVTFAGSGGNTAYGTATTNASGVVASASTATANNFGGGIGGYTSVGTANFTIQETGQPEFVTRQILNAWSTTDKYNLLIGNRAAGQYKFFFTPDDHEWSDNGDWTVTRLNNQFGTAFATLADVAQYYLKQQEGLRQFITTYTDNPSWRVYGGDVPAALVGILTPDQILIKDFYIDYDDNGNIVTQGGAVRVYYYDCVGSKSPLADPDSTAPGTNGVVKTMLGGGQKGRLLAAAQDAASKGMFFLDASSKDFFNVDNGDGWFAFSTERDSILTAFDAMGLSHLGLGSDRHNMHSSHVYKSDGGAYDVETLCGCPTATETMGITPYAQNDWTDLRHDGQGFTRCYWDSDAKVMTGAIVDHWSGDALRVKQIPLGSRKAARQWMARSRISSPVTDLYAPPTEQSFTLPSTGTAPSIQMAVPGGVYTYATLPAASALPKSTRVRVTDVGVGGSTWLTDGTTWRPDGQISCTGTPLNVIVAPIGSTAVRTDGGAATTFYVKESGNGASTGWVAK